MTRPHPMHPPGELAKDPLAAKVASKVRAVRVARGMSQVELAERAGLSQAHVSRVESGAMDMPLSTLGAIALALGVEPASLLLM
jgi:transcriptional regulator with XRE-family HTH domain